jgi:organic hydroperoxide reductase OsmC/OhrA
LTGDEEAARIITGRTGDAHRICPYSKATRDNIPVTVKAVAVA